LREIPHPTKFNKVGVADVINDTEFDNDRSKDYKVTEGRILPRSIWEWPVAYNTVARLCYM